MAITYHAGRRIQGLSLTTSDNFSSTSGWTQNDSAKIGLDTSNDKLDFNIVLVGNDNAYRTIPTGGSTWVMRYLLRFSTISTSSGSNIYFLVDISDDGTTAGNNFATGSIGLYMNVDESSNNSLDLYGNGATSDEIFVPVVNTDYYVEVIKTSATTATATVGTDAYGGTANGGSGSITGLTASTAQDTFAVRNRGTSSGSSGHSIIGYIKDFQFNNNTNTAGDVKPANVQEGSRFEETDTRKMYHYGDYPTVSDDLTTDKGWVSNTGSWTYNASGDYIDFATITRSTTAQQIYIDVQDSDYLGSGNNLSDSSWVARFKIRTGTQSSSQGNVLLYLGFSNNLGDSGTTQQSATMQMNFNGQANENNMQLAVSRANFETTGSPARVNSDVYSNTNLPYSTDLYMEMTRNGDVFTLKAYSDEYSTQATSTSIASATVTGISTLRYIKAFNDSEQAQSYTSGGARLYDMKIYNGVTSAGNEWKELGT